MKYTTLLASMAALQPALALPQAIDAPAVAATPSNNTAAPETATGKPPLTKAVGVAGRNQTGSDSKTSGGEESIDIEADFGPSSPESPGKVTVERAKNNNGSAIAITAQSSGPFKLVVRFNAEEAQKTIADDARTAGLPDETIKSVVQPIEQIALSNSTANGASNSTTGEATGGAAGGAINGTAGATSVDTKEAVRAVAEVAAAAAAAKTDGPRVPLIQISIQGTMRLMFGDSEAGRGLMNVIVGAAAAGEDLKNVFDCALGFMEAVTAAADKRTAPPPAQLPSPSGPAGSRGPDDSQGPARTVTPPGPRSSSVTAPTQSANPQPSQPSQDVKAPAVALDNPEIRDSATKGCKNELCLGMVGNGIKMTSVDISMRVSMTILQVMLDVGGAPENVSQPAASGEQTAPAQQQTAKNIGDQCIEKFQALDERADTKQTTQIISSVIENNDIPNAQQVETRVEQTAQQAEKVPAVAQQLPAVPPQQNPDSISTNNTPVQGPQKVPQKGNQSNLPPIPPTSNIGENASC